MSGDKELFEMMGKRGTTAGQLPARQVHFIPEAREEAVLAMDRRIQKIHEHRFVIIGAAILLAFLIGVGV